MDKKHNLYEAIEIMSKNTNVKFKRFGDEDFIIERGSYGDVMMRLGNIVRPLPIFLYLHDFWLKMEE